MTREELIKQCRYYKGEEKNPFDGCKNLCWYWDMERVYVGSGGAMFPMRVEYEAYGGKKFPGIPYELLIIMFTSWGKHSSDLRRSLPQFYMMVEDYLFGANGHYPEGRIPGQ